MTRCEVEWDADQQALMLALDLLRNQTCSGCGQPLAESTQFDNEYGYVAVPVPCHSCESVARARDSYMSEHNSGGRISKHATPSRFSIKRR